MQKMGLAHSNIISYNKKNQIKNWFHQVIKIPRITTKVCQRFLSQRV